MASFNDFLLDRPQNKAQYLEDLDLKEMYPDYQNHQSGYIKKGHVTQADIQGLQDLWRDCDKMFETIKRKRKAERNNRNAGSYNRAELIKQLDDINNLFR